MFLWVEYPGAFFNCFRQPLMLQLLRRRFGDEAAAAAGAHESIDAFDEVVW
jgi:hypothetical protein